MQEDYTERHLTSLEAVFLFPLSSTSGTKSIEEIIFSMIKNWSQPDSNAQHNTFLGSYSFTQQ